MTDDLSVLATAWAAIHDATPPGWFVGRPSHHPERAEWVIYGFDTTERAKAGVRSREWTAIADSELGVLVEMAHCLREIRRARATVTVWPGEFGMPHRGWNDGNRSCPAESPPRRPRGRQWSSRPQ